MGTISSSSTVTYRLTVGSQDPLTVTATGTIATGDAAAIYGSDDADWTITNSGSLSSSAGTGFGIDLLAGGLITNTGRIAATGNYGTAIALGAAGSVDNRGTITGGQYGIDLASGGTVLNAAGAVLSGDYGGINVRTGGVTIRNEGAIGASNRYAAGIDVGAGSASISNSGLVFGEADGIEFAKTTGTVENSGTISASGPVGNGIDLRGGGSVTNEAGGTVRGPSRGIGITGGTGTVTNAGTIAATGTAGTGIYADRDVIITNTGLVSGEGVGISVVGAGTITNAGTISGDSAIVFAGTTDNRLILDPGAVTIGTVRGGGGGNTLELLRGAAYRTGTLSGFATQFVGFNSIVEDSGARWVLDGASPASGQTVAMSGTGSLLALTQSSDFLDAINGFSIGDLLDLRDLSYTPGATVELSGTALTIDSGGEHRTLTLLGLNADSHFTLADDGTASHGVLLGQTMPCFAAGTRIRTARGEIAVEALTEGDLAIVREDGRNAVRPIRWIGRRRVEIGRHPRPELVRPVRFATGSLADGIPVHPLLLSPDHALLLDGVLVAARQLVNGAGIAAMDLPVVEYFHVELDRHGILLAEGAEVESYLDTGNRHQFVGCNHTALHADFSRRDHPAACLPLSTEPAVVEPIWSRLATRSGLSLPAATPDPGGDPMLQIELPDGVLLRPRAVAPDRFRVRLDGGVVAPVAIRLRSRHAAPADARPWLDDRRQLGVCVSALRVWTVGAPSAPRALPLDGADAVDDQFGSGWWDCEQLGELAWRWTDGAATLVLPAGSLLLEIEIRATGPYPPDTGAGGAAEIAA